MRLRAESIGASSMRMARKTAKLFACLGSSTQLGQTIVMSIMTVVLSLVHITTQSLLFCHIVYVHQIMNTVHNTQT